MKNFYKNSNDVLNALKSSGLTQQEFSSKIGITRQTLRNWIKRGGVKESEWYLISNNVTRNIDYKINDGSIMMVEEAVVTAGFETVINDAFMIPQELKDNMPLLRDAQIGWTVYGKSMKGFVDNGETVAARRIYNKEFIEFGKAYIVVTKSDQFKTLCFLNRYEEGQDPNYLYMSKHNIEQFTGQPIHKDEILELWLVLCKVVGL